MEALAELHRTSLVTPLLSNRLEKVSVNELTLYVYGVLAAQDEIDQFRAETCAPIEHEGFHDCEVYSHFWRGVFDTRGRLYMHADRRSRVKSKATNFEFPIWKIQGSSILLIRMFDFFQRYSPFPEAATERAMDTIYEDKNTNTVELSGIKAQMAAFNLYDGATVGAFIGLYQSKVANWEPVTGWCAGRGNGKHNPRQPDLSKLMLLPDLPDVPEID